jgi:hypothetical protein
MKIGGHGIAESKRARESKFYGTAMTWSLIPLVPYHFPIFALCVARRIGMMCSLHFGF